MSRNLFIIFAALFAVCFGSSLIPRLPDHRIVGGKSVSILEHPHQARLLVFNTHTCGASIISQKWVITAAHCTRNPVSYYSVSVGSSGNSGIKYSVNRIISHPMFNSNTLDYDVSLVEVKGTIGLSSVTRPIVLATSEPRNGAIVNITGWGALSESGNSPSMLQVVSVPIINRGRCQNAYTGFANVTERMICAGVEEGGKDSCQGDSGGPLSSNGILYGIVSWGYGCARPRYPGVYTNVALLRSWIAKMSGV